MKAIEKTIITLLILLFAANIKLEAYTIRQLTNADGLTNSAVLSLSQTPDGFMWFGTCDGMSLYDGLTIRPYGIKPEEELCGNLIEDIITADNNDTWVITNYGVTYMHDSPRRIISFPEFKRATMLRRTDSDIVFVVARNGHIFYNEPANRSEFLELDAHGLIKDKLLDIVPFRDWIFLVRHNGIAKCKLERNSDGILKLTKTADINLSIKDSYNDDGNLFLLLESNKLCVFDPLQESINPLLTMTDYIRERGDISDVSYSRDNSLFVAFKNNGVLKFNSDGCGGYRADDIGIRGGIFAIKRDRYQDVIWIGSDGNGVYVYANDAYSIKMITYPQIANSAVSPVRSLLLDGNTLWVGTKGDGLVEIKNFDCHKSPQNYDFEKFTTHNSALLDNSVYALTKSARPLIWVGTDNGVCYYDHATNKLHRLNTPPEVRYIHTIYEESDSVLWLTSVGNGVLRVSLGGSAAAPVVKDVKRYTIDNGFFNSNFFFTLTKEKHDEDMLFGNRGLGVFKIANDSLWSIPLRNHYPSNIVNDAFAIKSTGDTLWIGTGAGLIMQSPTEERLYGPHDGFPKSAIHSMERDAAGNLWIATNKGLVHLDVKLGRTQTYSHLNGLEIMEFSDGASAVADGMILFGGINGVAIIKASPQNKSFVPYAPGIFFTQLKVNGHEVYMQDYADTSDPNSLVFSPYENNIKISFAAPDHINGGNYVYYYRFGGEKEWTRSYNDNSVNFTNMPYGTYSIDVKYYNPVYDLDSEVFTLKLRLLPPWYLSIYAKVLYLLCFLALILLIFIRYRNRVRERQNRLIKEMERSHKEEIYEEKLRFFTNITHELCTPLTLMYGPCERILKYDNSDGYIRKYVQLIKNNTERLNALIQEVIDFRRMETGHKQLSIASINITDICHEVVASFCDLAEQNHVNFETDIEPSLIWNSDASGLYKILYNLVSNAFKYTPDNGIIRLSASKEGGRLVLSVYNTGKGISPEDCKKVFNRYAVLDSVEENATKGLSARNGLGLAICESMVKMLGGNISIESQVGSYAKFVVSLPQAQCTEPAKDHPMPAPAPAASPAEKPAEESAPASKPAPRQDSPALAVADHKDDLILIVDDNPDILMLLADGLSDYNVISASDAPKALDLLKEKLPALIITDVMMPGTDGMELTRQIKSDRHTRHIPIIILSAKNENDDRVEGINSGADVYVSKPFKMDYLRAVIARLLKTRCDMREYYNTSASAFEYSEGQLMHKEDIDFIRSAVEYIHANMDHPDLSVESMAEHFQLSVRNLYRKFKELDQPAPNEFIKNQRINHAAKLLLTTSLTVQEIMYKCGFSNLPHFYKEFAKRFETTPKAYRQQGAAPDEQQS